MKKHKWSRRQKKALKASVKHWEEDNVKLINPSISWNSCACCLIYFRDECRSCPIRMFTGEVRCNSTPYREAAQVFSNREAAQVFSSGLEFDARFVKVSKKEVKFLKKVLEAGEQNERTTRV